MIGNILVYLDGTKRGESVLPIAVEIASQISARLILVNIAVQPSILSGAGTFELEPIEETDYTDKEQSADFYLENIAETWRDQGLDVESIMVHGPFEESLIACARSFKVGMIIMSTDDGNVLTRLFAGGTMERILKKTGLPVLGLNPGKHA